MNHPIEYELFAKQKMNALIAEGLRNQSLHRQRQAALGQRGPAEAVDQRSPPRAGVASRILAWARRITWLNAQGRSLGL